MANKWVEKSLELAWRRDYLDQLMSIYPAILGFRENLPSELKIKIDNAFSNKNERSLIEAILSARKQNYPFPIEHPYAALLGGLPQKTKQVLLDRNPKLINTIAKVLFLIGLPDVIKGMERPPDINRQMGSSFRQWLKKYFSNKKEFSFGSDLVNTDERKITFFDGADAAIESYVRTVLKVNLPELNFRRDLLVNVDGIIIVGEARFLSTSGGSQSRDIGNTLQFVKTVNTANLEHFRAIAIIDGVVWFSNSYKKIMEDAPASVPIMSALLLEEYLQEVKELSKKN